MGFYWVGTLLSAVLMVALFHFDGLILAIMATPILGWFLSRALVHGGAELWHRARQDELSKWSGRYYQFGATHLRADVREGQLYFLERDLLKVIEQPESRTVELFGPDERVHFPEQREMALSEAGCERLLRKCPHPNAKMLLTFLQREAFRPHAKKKAAGSPVAANTSE